MAYKSIDGNRIAKTRCASIGMRFLRAYVPCNGILRRLREASYSVGVSIAFSSRLRWPAPINELSALRAALRADGRPILDFSESNPTRVGLEEPDLGLLVNPANLLYEPDPHGLSIAREALAASYSPPAGLHGGGAKGIANSSRPRPVSPRELFLCASTSEAYGWLFKLLCDPGDAVLVPKPGYPLFDYLAGLEAVEARPYRLEYSHPSGWAIDLGFLESALETGGARALVLINPNNPTGSYIAKGERKAVVALCDRYGCALIVDEVFFGFPVECDAAKDGRSSFVGEEGVLTFVLDGLSKRLGLPQMKLGWICASGKSGELQAALDRLEIIADAYLSAGAPIMNALPRLLEGSEPFARRACDRLAANLATLRAILEGQDSPHRVLRCAGGWTAIIESPRLLPEDELAEGLLREEGLWSYPGYFFDMEREAFFTAGLMLPPALLERGARAYASYFDRLLG
jgi:alanine-synthesizing transaminase